MPASTTASPAQTSDIQRLAGPGVTIDHLAQRFNLTPEAVERVLRPKTAVTLFSGIGSSSLAAQRTGHDLLAVFEKWEPARKTLAAHGFPVAGQGDVKKVDFREWALEGPVDLLVGGPPCQPFSQSANNAGEYDARDCIPDFIRAIRDLRPKLWIMEEVQTLTWKKHADYFARVLADLRAEGYEVDYRVIDCSKQGVAQKRKRLFIIGRHIQSAGCREVRPSVQWPEDLPVQTMADALGWDAAEAWHRSGLAPAGYCPEAQWVYERPSTTVVGSFRPEVQAAPGYRTAGMGPRQNARGSVVITEAEALTLQGLPRDWEIVGNETERRLQIGNSCPTITLQRLIEANQG